MKKHVINIFGGPGVGKSTIAAGLFFRMKCQHYDVELVDEYAKYLVYQDRLDVLEKDQPMIFAEQHARIRCVLDKRELVIVDSPLLLSRVYFNEEGNIADNFLFSPLVLQIFSSYNNINFYIKRNPDLPFEKKGRVQTTVEEAKKVDNRVLHFLEFNSIPFTKIMSSEVAVELLNQHLKKELSYEGMS